MNNFLNMKRIGLLIRKEALFDWRSWTVVSVVLLGVSLLVRIVNTVIGNVDEVVYTEQFFFILFVWGLIAAGRTFRELHSKERNEDFLLLPASSLEKTASRLIWTAFVLPLFIMVLVTLISLVTEGFTLLIFKNHHMIFNPLDSRVWKSVGHFIIIQSLFFLGAAWFRSIHLIKTVLTLVVFGIIFSLVILLTGHIVSLNTFDLHLNWTGHGAFFLNENFREFMYVLTTVFKILYFALLAPFCWVAAWLRVKETQTSHGI